VATRFSSTGKTEWIFMQVEIDVDVGDHVTAIYCDDNQQQKSWFVGQVKDIDESDDDSIHFSTDGVSISSGNLTIGSSQPGKLCRNLPATKQLS
jgi:hypothetical protein